MSSARSRQQKRQAAARQPGVWQPGNKTTQRPEHSARDEITISWRLFSGGIVVGLGLVLGVFFLTDLFTVQSIVLEGAEYLEESEVFRYADIAEDHLFWVNPDDVRQNLLDATPLIAEADVRIGWPPDMVTIVIDERKPSLLWTQSGVRVLLDIHGNVLRAPRDDEQFPELIHVIADDSFNTPRLPGDPVPGEVVTGVLQLQRTASGLPGLRYNAVKGLGFREQGSSWDVWLGTGDNIVNKLRVYEALRDDLLARGITPVEINVADLDAVYYCGSVEFCYE
jgi:hypothetical protein